jgi:hypothetical protein
MTRLSSRLCATGLALALVLASASAANADHRRHDRGNSGAAIGAAIIGGLVIGGLIASSQPAYAAPAYAGPNPHADWCYRNTPGYNAYDNTYQGYYAGQRFYCRSPYGG